MVQYLHFEVLNFHWIKAQMLWNGKDNGSKLIHRFVCGHLTVANSAMMDVYCTSTISHFLGFDLSPPRYLDFPNNNHHLLSFRGFLQHLCWHQWWCLTWQNWALNRLQKQSPEKSLYPSCGDGVSPEKSTKPWVRESCSLGTTAQK